MRRTQEAISNAGPAQRAGALRLKFKFRYLAKAGTVSAA
jgi:hypothetical protein